MLFVHLFVLVCSCVVLIPKLGGLDSGGCAMGTLGAICFREEGILI